MAKDPESSDYTANDRATRDAPTDRVRILRRIRLPAAACPTAGWMAAMHRARNVYLLTLLSAIDGTLLVLGASDRLTTFGGALVVGLTVIAGAGSWVAAREGWAGRRDPFDKIAMATLGILTVTATVASVWLGSTLSQAMTLHVLPKAAGLLLVAIGAEIAGLRLPRVRGVPLPLAFLATAGLLEVLVQWTY